MSGQVRASHLLVKHSGSRRPASWKDEQGVVIKARTKAQAMLILQGFRDQIVNKTVEVCVAGSPS